jgi:hypothetical protein
VCGFIGDALTFLYRLKTKYIKARRQSGGMVNGKQHNPQFGTTMSKSGQRHRLHTN